ncbi:DUF2158 domain-containing protein [Rhizobium daejeonense]|uniref:DUF2158 domain-containing protein n=1 Tax=Rhizobium daejeonense TaxID=240521 RepID=A0A6M1RRI3_9HYPH|nr:DUF2158 domain-containing protein [Rhizobium daejeonense]
MANAPTEISAGSVVQAKSGGPRMTVSSVSDGTALVQWFNGSTLNSARMPVHSLIHDDDIEYSFGA